MPLRFSLQPTRSMLSTNHAGHNHAMPGRPRRRKWHLLLRGRMAAALKQAGDLQIETSFPKAGCKCSSMIASGQAVSVDQGRGSASAASRRQRKTLSLRLVARWKRRVDGSGESFARSLADKSKSMFSWSESLHPADKPSASTKSPRSPRAKSNWPQPRSHGRKSVPSAASRSAAWAILSRSMSTDKVCSFAVPDASTPSSPTRQVRSWPPTDHGQYVHTSRRCRDRCPEGLSRDGRTTRWHGNADQGDGR